jgi:hypothetical protein
MRVFGYKEKQETQAKQHFFAASVYDWATTTNERDLPALLKLMDGHGTGYNLFLVPLHYEEGYDINFFTPQVEGTQWLGFFDVKKGKRK